MRNNCIQSKIKLEPETPGRQIPTPNRYFLTYPEETEMNLLNNAVIRIPKPINEPINSFAPGSTARASLKEALARMATEHLDIPLIIGGEEARTGKVVPTP